TDVAVLRRLYASHKLEAQSGFYAKQRAGSGGVRDFGERLRREHTEEAQAADDLAKKKGIALAGPEAALHEGDHEHLRNRAEEVEGLAGYRGGVSDARFLELTMAGHDDLRDYLQAAQDAVRDPEVRALVSAEIPVAETQAQLARDLYSRTDRHAIHLGHRL